MTERDDMRPELDDYIEALPAAERPARDLSARRQRLLPTLRAHTAHEHGRARRRRILIRTAGLTVLGGAAAALALALAVPAARRNAATATAIPVRAPAALAVVDGTVLLESAGVARTLHAGDTVNLASVGALEAPAERAVRVRLSDVVALTLEPSSRVRPIATGAAAGSDTPPALEVLALERGRAHLQVKKLGGARRFHVLTPDADVEVRGTAFDVALRPGAVPQTCVSVSEGLVLVASGLTSRLLQPGESWGCGQASGGEVKAGAAGEAVAEPRTRTATRSRTRTGGGERADVEFGLGEQNRLFQMALAAERAGRYDEAVKVYRQLLARAPEGPLAAQARANLASVGTPR